MEIEDIYPHDMFAQPVFRLGFDSSLGVEEECERQKQASRNFFEWEAKWTTEWIIGATIKERAARYEKLRGLLGPSEYRFWTPSVGRELGIDGKELDKVIGKHIFGRVALFRYWNATTYPNAFKVDHLSPDDKCYVMNEMGLHILLGLILRIPVIEYKFQALCRAILEDACHFYNWKPWEFRSQENSDKVYEQDLIYAVYKEIRRHTDYWPRGRESLFDFIAPTREIV